MAETAKEYTESVAAYTNALINERLSLVPQVCRVEKVLFSGTAGTIEEEYSLNGKVTDYDEIVVYMRMLSNNGANYSILENRISDINVGTVNYYPQSVYNTTDNYQRMTINFKTATSFIVGGVNKGNANNNFPEIYKIIGIKYVNPNNYSTEEKMVGYWIDGKPLYQKTVNFGTLPNKTTKSVTHGINNLGFVANVCGIAFNSSAGSYSPIPFAHPSTEEKLSASLQVATDVVRVTTLYDWSTNIGYVTIQYTKTV